VATKGMNENGQGMQGVHMMEVEPSSAMDSPAAGGAAAFGGMATFPRVASGASDKGLLAHMAPHLRDACISRMRVYNFSAGQAIIEQDTIGTTMVVFPPYGQHTLAHTHRITC
jgi:hypothetical protein